MELKGCSWYLQADIWHTARNKPHLLEPKNLCEERFLKLKGKVVTNIMFFFVVLDACQYFHIVQVIRSRFGALASLA